MKLFTKTIIGLTLIGGLIGGGTAVHRLNVVQQAGPAAEVLLPTGSFGSEVAGSARNSSGADPVGEKPQKTLVEPASPGHGQQLGWAKARQSPPAATEPSPGHATPGLPRTQDVHGIAPAPGASPPGAAREGKTARGGKPAPGMDFDRWDTPAQRAASALFGVAVDAGLVPSGSGYADELAKVVRFEVEPVQGMSRTKQQHAIATLVTKHMGRCDALAGFTLDLRIGPEYAARPALVDPGSAPTSTVAPRPARTP